MKHTSTGLEVSSPVDLVRFELARNLVRILQTIKCGSVV